MRTLLIAAALLLSGCAAATAVPRQPFNGIPIPVQWVPYSRESVIVQSPTVTAAKLIYLAESKVDVDGTVARVNRRR